MADGRFTILIAEDNRALSQVMRFNLDRAGFETCVANHGAEAVQRLQERSFDLLITDYQMPIMDGAELCRQVREVLQLKDLPIALCSAKGLEADAANLVVRHGISKVFYKPTSPQAVVTFARELMTAQQVARTSAPEVSC